MSSIWTPGGEHKVPRPDEPARESAEPAPLLEEDELSPEEMARLEEAAGEVARVRAQLAAAPPELVITNHLMGFYELAAIHLDRDEPDLAAAKLAIDALTGVLDACKGRLGENEKLLADARTQIQLAFVSVSRQVAAPAD